MKKESDLEFTPGSGRTKEATGGLRLSIQPTYDSRETGARFSVETLVNGRSLRVQRIADPFVRTTVSISIWGCLKSILLGGCFVEVRVSGDKAITEDILELDANYIGHGNTRRAEWNVSIESALSEHAENAT